MAHVSSAVEYGLHCLMYLVASPSADEETWPVLSARDVAELQGVSAEYVAKIFTRLEKSALVVSIEGVDGGFKLARPAAKITALDVIDAIDGEKPLFECQQIRTRNAVFEGKPPSWATRGTCGIHAVMLAAEKKMREELAAHTLADMAKGFARIAPTEFGENVVTWLTIRKQNRRVSVDQKRSPRKARKQ